MCALIVQIVKKICQLSKCNITLRDIAHCGSLSWECRLREWQCTIALSSFDAVFFVWKSKSSTIILQHAPPDNCVTPEKLRRSWHLSHSAPTQFFTFAPTLSHLFPFIQDGIFWTKAHVSALYTCYIDRKYWTFCHLPNRVHNVPWSGQWSQADIKLICNNPSVVSCNFQKTKKQSIVPLDVLMQWVVGM